MSTLYVVATPIGNLEDVTLRALRVLGEVELIAAEDTRVTSKLLSRYEIDTPLTSYNDHNKLAKLPMILEALGNKDVALVSDAGTPAINDPGAELVKAASEAGHDVVPIPGASAVTTALSIAGVPLDQFVYLGFLPRRGAERRKLLSSLVEEPRPLVAFETPHRFVASLADMAEILGDRHITVCRELTKVHEEVFRGSIVEVTAHFREPKGEFTLVIDGAITDKKPDAAVFELARTIFREQSSLGHSAKDAIEVASQTGLPKNELYRLWIETARGE